MDTARQPRFIKWSLVFAITIVSNLFIGYALSLVYKAPVWNDFCPTSQVIDRISTKEQCVAQGGQWNANTPQYYDAQSRVVPEGSCDLNYTCNQKWTDANSAYSRNVFVILVVMGVVLIILGSFVGGGNVVRTGLAFSGSLSFVIASVRYWGEAHDWLKVVILGVALAALIWLAVKKFSEKVRP